VVNLFAKWKRGEAQEMQQTRDKQRVDFPRGLVFLHTMCRSRGDSLKVLQKHPFERLNISSGDEAAEARVRAVRSSSLFFYPSNVHLDCFEVRFFDKKTSTARYERFFASVDVSELDNYIIIAAEMDDAARLHPATLSLDDPGMFWSICFRLEACYSHLKKCSPEIASAWGVFWQSTRRDRLRAAADGWDWSKLCDQVGKRGGGGSEGHTELAQRGYSLAIKQTLFWAEDTTPLHIEQDENDTISFAGVAINHASNTIASEALEVGAKVRVHSLQMDAHLHCNGCLGTLLRYLPDTQRWQVSLHVLPSANLALKPKNLTLISDSSSNLSRMT